MQKRPPAPELKALLAHLQANISPKQRLKIQAELLTTDIIARVQRQSHLKK